jgi:hypothetical protein
LLLDVAEVLTKEDIHYAVIGAMAIAAAHRSMSPQNSQILGIRLGAFARSIKRRCTIACTP